MKTDHKIKADPNVPKIAKLEGEVAELKDKLTRSLADYINLEKRFERDKEFIINLATASVLSKMIDVLDDFNLANRHLNDAGLKMAIDKFVAVLKAHGVDEINPNGDQFDPQTMEVIATVDGEDNKVISVEKKGYSINQQVIRPAQVIVGKKAN